MGEESVTYLEVKIQSPSHQQRTCNRSETQDSSCRHPGFCARVSPWKLIALVLWFVCVGLLVCIGILATNLGDSCAGNLTSRRDTEQERLISRNFQSQEPASNVQVWKCRVCESGWFQWERYCYSFSKTLYPWDGCARHCSATLSSFLKISAKEEMDFVAKQTSNLQFSTHQNKFWTSLYYNTTKMKWEWQDGSALAFEGIQVKKPAKAKNVCKYIQEGRWLDGNCNTLAYCTCKRSVDGD